MPDLKGYWVGTTEPIVAGRGGPHWPEGQGTWDKPALPKRALTLHIVGQEGRRFWGKSVLGEVAGSGMVATEEPFIGTLAPDGSTYVMADTDGYVAGKVSGPTLSYCYTQAGGAKGRRRTSGRRVSRTDEAVTASTARAAGLPKRALRSSAQAAAS
ncbi:MAG: hypothetical protein INR62_09935 [Rhodospirillales bacterium]|nr:hypothetical protein [Acetobacter sp.]